MTPVVVWVLCSPLPIPRILKSVPRPKLLIVVEGATNCSWSTTSTPNLDRSSPDRTVAETAAVFSRTARRCVSVSGVSFGSGSLGMHWRPAQHGQQRQAKPARVRVVRLHDTPGSYGDLPSISCRSLRVHLAPVSSMSQYSFINK